MNIINDINIKKWKEYDDILTDSLWIIDKRDNSGSHKGDYHGNFIPQIPNQLIKRYTREGDWVLDPFLGSGTTLIECKRLKRNGIGIDIDLDILNMAEDRVGSESGDSSFEFINYDSAKINLADTLKKYNKESVQFILYHPPYWDIIKFNDIDGNLASNDTLESFLKGFSDVVDNTIQFLDEDRYIGIVIGDIYKNSQWIPLSSHITQLMLEKKLLLKSIVVKNISETKAKRNNKAIWRYRALLGGFYVFNHEYILIFQNKKRSKK